MGARQSKRSVDITTTPKKDGLPVEGVVGDAAAPGDGKLEKIEETDTKPTTNGVAPHTDATPEDKDKDKDEATEKENDKEEDAKAEEVKVESPTTETPAEGTGEVTTPTEGTPASPTTATSPDSKETKKKDKLKKKWSFRSISFGKKDKSKPAREDAPKNGDVTKEEPLTEGGEEAENAEGGASSPTEEKSLSSPTEKEQSSDVAAEKTTPEAAKAEETKTPVESSPVEKEMKDETSTPVPTPVPVVEANNTVEDTIEKQCELASVVDKKVEVSQVQTVIEASPVEANSQSKQKSTVATTTTTTNYATTAPSIIERKTSEDIPSQFPSSPPPTPIDPSPLQQAQQVAANATALAEALKLPAEAANKANITYASGDHDATGTFATSQIPAWPNVTTTTIPIVAKPLTQDHDITVRSISSESHEQTGKASPINVVASGIDNATDFVDKTVLLAAENLAELPVLENVTKLPVVDNVTELPLAEKFIELPAVEKRTEILVAEKIIELPIVEKLTELPVEKEIIELPVAAKVTELPLAESITELPVADKILELPVADKITELPVAENIIELPIVETITKLPIPEKIEDLPVADEIAELPVPEEIPELIVPEKTPELSVVEQISELPVAEQMMETISNEKPRENDLVIHTEEGPIPISDDIVFEAKPAIVIPDSPVEESKTIEILLEKENNRESIESVKVDVDSREESPIQENKIIEVIKTVSEPIAPVDREESKEEILEKDVPPPLPESPIPVPKVTSQLLNFITTQIEDSSDITKMIDVEEDTSALPEEAACLLSWQMVDRTETIPTIKKIEKTNESDLHADEQLETSSSLPPPEEVPGSRLDELSQTVNDVELLPPPAPQEITEDCPVSFEEDVLVTDNTTNSTPVSAPSPISSVPQIPTEMTLLTSPRSPTSSHTIENHSVDELPTKEISELSDESCNREFKMESVPQNLNSFNHSEHELKERLAESTDDDNTSEQDCHLSLRNVQDNDQSKTEPEAPVENNVVQNDIGTTEDEAPMSPPPAVPVDAPAPIHGPAITEDVASVTKAIEEIDINEKAVAAAVNENIESINTNEIIADMNHQNNMNE